MLAAVIFLEIQWQAQAWLGLFGLLAFPLCLTAWILLLVMRLLKKGRNWLLVWFGLLSLSCLTSWAALHGYDWWVNTNELDGLNSVQAFVSSQIFTCLLLGLPLWRNQTQSREVQIANLKQLALAAELKALQAQVEPHFLYNTLANSRYLARHDPNKAVQMLDHLIAYLQSALPDLRQPMSTVGREFELAENYLALMAIRFGDRLRFQLNYVPALRDIALPPMMLMSLVENAVQHGVERQPGQVDILLQAEEKNGCLHVIVSDNGAGLEQNVIGHGVGLRNLRERLQALYAGDARFELRMTPEKRTVAELIVPLISSTT
ncbi:histidine kinase [Undibacterium sp. FT147W]|uniref:Histidine kinase n=1 Tax=Undibacterium rivi TaxID=2828729 RepID=A0ABS5H2P2_9BURK|nr:histidine kinase [Undibacterium rivi]MBR7792966.1 histidine kinase [Undibacterium rivi]